jgi:nucleoside-diphosphate-sugar epimerase
LINRVLLTGGTGFVGRQVLRVLLERGSSVRLVLREGRDMPVDAATMIESVVRTPDLFTENSDWWAKACEGIDTIVHVAWYAEPEKYLQSPRNIECLGGTLRLATGAAKASVRRVVGVGSCAEYDLAVGNLSVDTPLRPTSPYAAAKAAAFFALSEWLRVQKVEFAWCRLFYLYGEGEDGRRLVPYLRKKLAAGEYADLTSGNQIRDFLDVRQAGRMIAEVALGSEQGPVNICAGVPVTVREFAERIADEYGRRDLLRFGARPDNLFDPPRVVGVRPVLTP